MRRGGRLCSLFVVVAPGVRHIRSGLSVLQCASPLEQKSSSGGSSNVLAGGAAVVVCSVTADKTWKSSNTAVVIRTFGWF